MKMLDDVMFEENIKRFLITFEQQFHYACSYAYMKIKEKDIKSIIWFAKIISLNKDSSPKLKKNYILQFKY